MNLYFEFILITAYMVITYHIIALKYRKSTGFSGFTRSAKLFWVSLHVFIVSTNIFLYFWFISKDFNPVSTLFSAFGLFLFIAGLFIIFWGMYTLRKAVFVPGNKEVKEKSKGYQKMITFVGTTYKMITAVTFPENPDANESPYFIPMLRLTHENYRDIDLVAGDAAYISLTVNHSLTCCPL